MPHDRQISTSATLVICFVVKIERPIPILLTFVAVNSFVNKSVFVSE